MAFEVAPLHELHMLGQDHEGFQCTIMYSSRPTSVEFNTEDLCNFGHCFCRVAFLCNAWSLGNARLSHALQLAGTDLGPRWNGFSARFR